MQTLWSSCRSRWTVLGLAAVCSGAAAVLHRRGDSTRLIRRTNVLEEIKRAVLLWEVQIDAELSLHRNTLFAFCQPHLSSILPLGLLQRLEHTLSGLGPEADNRHTTLRSRHSCTLGGTFDLGRYAQLCEEGHLVLSNPCDCSWLRRLDFLVQYAILRRLSLVEEARLHAALWRHTLFGANSKFVFPGEKNSHFYTASWKVFGAPSWIRRTATNTSVCVGLGYYPVFCFFSGNFEQDSFGWFQAARRLDRVWSAECSLYLKATRAAGHEDPCFLQATEICLSSLYLTVTRDLLRTQAAIGRQCVHRFFHDYLWKGIRGYRGCAVDAEQRRGGGAAPPGMWYVYRNAESNASLRWGLAKMAVYDFVGMTSNILYPSNGLKSLSVLSVLAPFTFLTGRSVFEVCRALLWSSVFAAIQSFLSKLSSADADVIIDFINNECQNEIQENLAHADEAFYSQLSVSHGVAVHGSAPFAPTGVIARFKPGYAFVREFKQRTRRVNGVITGFAALFFFRSDLRVILPLVVSEVVCRVVESHIVAHPSPCGASILSTDVDAFATSSLLYGHDVLLAVLSEAQSPTADCAFPFLSLLLASHVSRREAGSTSVLPCIDALRLLRQKVMNFRFGAAGSSGCVVDHYRMGVKFLLACDVDRSVPAASGEAPLPPELDDFEKTVFRSPRSFPLFPKEVDIESLVHRPFRFIARQFGLEAVFAFQAFIRYRDVYLEGQHRRDSSLQGRGRMVRDTLAFHAVELIRSCLLLVGLSVCRTEFSPTVLLHISRCRGVLSVFLDDSGGRDELVLRQCQQYLQNIPRTLDLSLVSSPKLQCRLQQWRDRYPSLVFDESNQIKSGIRLSRGVSFRNVFFSYPTAGAPGEGWMGAEKMVPTLNGVSFFLPASEKSAIVGPNGSGKSTVLKLLQGLYHPHYVLNGQCDCSLRGLQALANLQYFESVFPSPGCGQGGIFFDDIPVACMKMSCRRSWFVSVTSTARVYESLSLFQNISVFRDFVSNEDVETASRVCLCDQFCKPPLFLHGSADALSSGEQQRLLLARGVAALEGHYRQRCLSCPVWASPSTGAMVGLLLDEHSSSMDGQTKALLNGAVKSYLAQSPRHGVMVVTVTHDAGVLTDDTHVVVLVNGNVGAEGSVHHVKEVSAFVEATLSLQRGECREES
ncbi:ABC transporter, putative [Angomonas deanei]|uniref:ABC transporter, putative n=1 Tax=Angomonas deanei TaxID=59799 RepID=A0A7G2CPG4_9TRYP|nr:ABC transporter, putative [Angomonas deanei]